jgi:hypothetical protein
MVRYAPDTPAYERDVGLVQERLGAHEFNAPWGRGRAMHPEQAIAYVVEESSPR